MKFGNFMFTASMDPNKDHQVIDEAMEMFYQGDSTEMIDTCPVQLTKKNIHKYQRRMTDMLQLAQTVERLINLIGDPV